MSFDLNKLTYLAQKRTQKAIDLNNKLKLFSRLVFLLYISAAFSLLFVLTHLNMYLNNYVPTLGVTVAGPRSIDIYDKLTLFVLFISLFAIYFIEGFIKSLKKKYKSIRKDIVQSLENGFFTDKPDDLRDCKEEYLKHLENQKVDLVQI